MKISSFESGPRRGCHSGARDPTPVSFRKATRLIPARRGPPLGTVDTSRRKSLRFGRSGKRRGPMEVYRNYIDGAWVDAASGRTLEVINPATLEAIARVPDSGAADVDRAVTAASRAFDDAGWAQPSARGRGLSLVRLAVVVLR